MPSMAACAATVLAAALAAAEAAMADEEGDVGMESFSLLELLLRLGSHDPVSVRQKRNIGKVKLKIDVHVAGVLLHS
jgi:hypothetical protein